MKIWGTWHDADCYVDNYVHAAMVTSVQLQQYNYDFNIDNNNNIWAIRVVWPLCPALIDSRVWDNIILYSAVYVCMVVKAWFIVSQKHENSEYTRKTWKECTVYTGICKSIK